MNLAARLAYFANTSRFPFFGGWIAPVGSNPTLTSGSSPGITLDVIVGAPIGDQFLRAYYRDLTGGACNIALIDLYARNIDSGAISPDKNTPGDSSLLGSEFVTLRFKPNVPLMGVFLLSKAFGDPAPAMAIYGAIQAAAVNQTLEVSFPIAYGIANTIAPDLAPSGKGIDVTDPATIKGLTYFVAAGVLTQAQSDSITNLPLPSFA